MYQNVQKKIFYNNINLFVMVVTIETKKTLKNHVNNNSKQIVFQKNVF